MRRVPEKVKLLFGPYEPPSLKKGDRASCLYRDCDVLVTSWSDGRISWPRGRPLGSRSGAPGLVVDEELARAIRGESAWALVYWWGVSTATAWLWRAALGVEGRTGTEGTRRLVRAAAEKGAAVNRARASTDRGRRAREQSARRRPAWRAEHLALLGTAPDPEVARQVGRSLNAVRTKRVKLGIPASDHPSANEWTAAELALLGKLPDDEVACRTGRAVKAVRVKRSKLGIPNPEAPAWTDAELALLGTAPDEVVARQIGRTLAAVACKRSELGIPHPTGRYWSEGQLALLGTAPDEEVAARIGKTPGAVCSKRCQLAIPSFRDRRRREG